MRRLAPAFLACSTALALAAAAALGVSACSQAEGAYCQVDGDCASGLTCVRATNTCQKPGVGVGDAGAADAAVDARPDGATAVDAAIDATTDAPVDADVDSQ